MTMHLAQGLSTLRTTKPKVGKLTKTQLTKYKEELRIYNKKLKQSHRHTEMLTIEEYVAKVHGKKVEHKPEQYKAPNEVKTYKWQVTGYRRDNGSHIPSGNTGVGNALAAPKKEYTGTLIQGIATMHKSNAVPVINQEEAEMISKMRRG